MRKCKIIMNIVKVDFRSYNSIDDFQRLIDDHNLSSLPYSASELLSMRSQVDFMYFDADNDLILMAFQEKKKNVVLVSADYANYLNEIKPIKFKKKSKRVDLKSYDLDFILDKINISGISSLSDSEKKFLEKMS